MSSSTRSNRPARSRSSASMPFRPARSHGPDSSPPATASAGWSDGRRRPGRRSGAVLHLRPPPPHRRIGAAGRDLALQRRAGEAGIRPRAAATSSVRPVQLPAAAAAPPAPGTSAASRTAPKSLALDLMVCAAMRSRCGSPSASPARRSAEQRRRHLEEALDQLRQLPPVAADHRASALSAAAVQTPPLRPAMAAPATALGGITAPSAHAAAAERRHQLLHLDRLADIVVHAGRQAHLAVTLHGVGGHGDDVGAPARQRRRTSPVASKPSITGICTSISTTS